MVVNSGEIFIKIHSPIVRGSTVYPSYWRGSRRKKEENRKSQVVCKLVGVSVARGLGHEQPVIVYHYDSIMFVALLSLVLRFKRATYDVIG